MGKSKSKKDRKEPLLGSSVSNVSNIVQIELLSGLND